MKTSKLWTWTPTPPTVETFWIRSWQSTEEGKDQKSMQSSTIPDPGQRIGKWQKYKKTSNTWEPGGQPFPNHKYTLGTNVCSMVVKLKRNIVWLINKSVYLWYSSHLEFLFLSHRCGILNALCWYCCWIHSRRPSPKTLCRLWHHFKRKVLFTNIYIILLLTIFIQIDYPIHIDKISMDLSILYFEESQVEQNVT